MPKASWGTLANDAIEYLFSYPYFRLLQALATTASLIFALNFIGDGHGCLDLKDYRSRMNMMEDTILDVENLRTSFAKDAGSVQSIGHYLPCGEGREPGNRGESGWWKSVTMPL